MGDVVQIEEKTELDKVIELMLNPANIGHLTELNSREILAFSTLSTLGKKYRYLDILPFVAENLVFRVSKGRKGRLETIKLTSRPMYDPRMMGGPGMGPERRSGFFNRWRR